MRPENARGFEMPVSSVEASSAALITRYMIEMRISAAAVRMRILPESDAHAPIGEQVFIRDAVLVVVPNGAGLNLEGPAREPDIVSFLEVLRPLLPKVWVTAVNHNGVPGEAEINEDSATELPIVAMRQKKMASPLYVADGIGFVGKEAAQWNCFPDLSHP